MSSQCVALVCGNNNDGQCGVSGDEEPLAKPTNVTKTVDLDYDHILAVASSAKQSYIVTSGYSLLSCGDNENGEIARTAGKRNLFLQIDMLSKYRIREVSAGNGFCHACTFDGRVISWGRNDLGQLGNGDRERQDKPRINSNFTESILQISCGETHAIALSKGGNVLTWGGNRKGQLGDGQLTSSCVPRVSTHLRHRPVIGVCAGANHCMAFTVTGNLYVWGDGAQGQLGLGDTNFRAYPTLVRSLRSAKVCGVAAGQHHSLALSPNGLVFAFGSNAHGQLGIGQPDTKFSTEPVVVDKLRDLFAVQVACGSAHSLVVCRRGERDRVVFGMGLNSSGQLGIGRLGSMHSPVALEFDEGIAPHAVASGCLSLHSFLFSQGVPLQRASLPRIDLQILSADCRSLTAPPTNGSSALQTLREHIAAAFSSISVLNASFFKVTLDHHDLSFSAQTNTSLVNLPAVREAYNLLLGTGDESVIATLGRSTLKLTEQLKECPYDDAENLNCFLIVLENPLLLNPQAFHIGIERVITGILALPASYRATLFSWLRSYEPEYFERIIRVMNCYLSYAITNTLIRLDTSPATLVLNR